MQVYQTVKEQIYCAINTQEKRYSAVSTLVITLITITPLCGYLFQCGCDWPWQGLDSHCNFYNSSLKQHCPWCASMASGVLSVGIAIIGGVWGSAFLSPAVSVKGINPGAIRIFQGLLIYLLLAYLSAIIAAFYQGYGLGVGDYFRSLDH
ncbi:MAG: hypothetical protein KAH20_07635 [Methylococcales bacterium]|nr:hypothetical protein [Methylococcales bacterium]